jgi:hypothetical protein
MESEIANEIRRRFDYLFSEHGFAFGIERHFDSYGNWAVVLQSGECGRIRIMQDRGEVLLALGPQWSPLDWDSGPWYGLDVVARYLSGGRDGFAPTLGQTDEQLERLAERLRPYIDQACSLLQEDSFEAKQGELDFLRQSIEDEVWQGLLGDSQGS